MGEMWQIHMAMGTVLTAVVTAVGLGWRVSNAMRRENREAHAGIRTEIQTVRGELGAEIAENRAEIARVRKDLTAEIAENREGIRRVRKDLGAEIAGVRNELGAGNVGIRKELGAEIAENREAIGGIREDIAAFKGHMDAKMDAHGARIDLLEARVARTGEDVAFIKGLLTAGGQE